MRVAASGTFSGAGAVSFLLEDTTGSSAGWIVWLTLGCALAGAFIGFWQALGLTMLVLALVAFVERDELSELLSAPGPQMAAALVLAVVVLVAAAFAVLGSSFRRISEHARLYREA